jgi:hypothetical protein
VPYARRGVDPSGYGTLRARPGDVGASAQDLPHLTGLPEDVQHWCDTSADERLAAKKPEPRASAYYAPSVASASLHTVELTCGGRYSRQKEQLCFFAQSVLR